MSNPAPPPLANNIDVLRIEAIKKPFTKLSFVNLKFSTWFTLTKFMVHSQWVFRILEN
jgi:hypothetical protein